MSTFMGLRNLQQVRQERLHSLMRKQLCALQRCDLCRTVGAACCELCICDCDHILCVCDAAIVGWKMACVDVQTLHVLIDA